MKKVDDALKGSCSKKNKKGKVHRKNWPEETKYNLEYHHQLELDKVSLFLLVCLTLHIV